MNGPEHDAHFYVPVELEREHLAAARRTVVRSTRAPSTIERASRSVRRAPHPQRRSRSVAMAVHLVAVLLVVALAVLTTTWAIAAVMSAAVGVSLVVTLRLIDLAQRPPVNEPQR